MLIEIWERLRGYDKWIETAATIKSSKLEEVVVSARKDGTPIYGWQGDEEIVWTDRDGDKQCEQLEVMEDSPVFQLYDGNPVVIRYNPANPSHFYVREQLRYEVRRSSKVILVVLVVIGIVLAIKLS